MRNVRSFVPLAPTAVAVLFALVAPTAPAQPAPGEVGRAVSFADDVHPIFQRSCGKCHLGPARKGDYSLNDRASAIAGGETGPAIVPGDAQNSRLIVLVEDRDEEGVVMPSQGPRLTPEEVATLRAWIDQGAVWDESFAAAGAERPIAPLAPRAVELPSPAAGAESRLAASPNPVDRLLAPYFAERRIPVPEPVDDARFARRAWFDVVGLPPSPEELAEFLGDPSPDRRSALVDRLLADSRGYAENWMTFWNDMLRNDFAGTGYIDGGREQITEWLYRSLATNKPYDAFVRELVAPTEGSRGFVKGINWRGATNASQIAPMQAAQNVSQVFMGTNLKCASCHDSFVNQWKLKDAYGLAAIFSEEPLEIHRCDSPQGETAEMHFLYPELGKIEPTAPRDERLKQLAAAIARPENGRLARTIVNRVWASFMGRGLVEPLDDMDQPAWSPDALDWLALDLAENGWDLKRTIRHILTSEAYRLPAVAHAESEGGEWSFRGPEPRRLSAEKFIDSVSALTGVWQGAPATKFELEPGADESPRGAAFGLGLRVGEARWIWNRPEAATSVPDETIRLRKTFTLRFDVEETWMALSCDNAFKLYVNGELAAEGSEWNKPVGLNLRPFVRPGRNVLAVEATNSAPGPAGFVAHVWLRKGDGNFDFGTDASWLASADAPAGWEKPGFDDSSWTPAADLGEADREGWKLRGPLTAALKNARATATDRVRAWRTTADPLMRALGRPNREQVVTRRGSVATTLEAIEMTNGATLAGTIAKGAETIARRDEDARALAERMFVQALGRRPTGEEAALALETLGEPPTREGVEDFVWALAMSPEFQILY